MEKIKLNNQVVLMRKYVKQAKVHVINKLVKQVKLLQTRKGSEVQVEKAKRKADRFLEEITLLKKIKPDEISKLALSKAKDWKDVLQQKNSTLHDRCVAMLANYAAVQKEVEVFHSTNKELVSKITDLIKFWDEKNKYPKDSSKLKKVSDTKDTDKCIKENFVNDVKNKLDVPIKSNSKLSRKVEKFQKNISPGKKQKSNEKNEITAKQDEKAAVKALEDVSSNMLFRQESCSDDEDIENTLEIKTSDDDDDLVLNTLKICKPDIDIEDKNVINKISNNKSDLVEDVIEAENSDSDENIKVSMEIEKSDCNDEELINDDITENTKETEAPSNEDSDNDEELINDSTHSTKETKTPRNEDSDDEEIMNDVTKSTKEIKTPRNEDSVVNKLQKSEELKTLNTDNNNKKKLKTVAFLNLDELQGLDEIPISSESENDEETSEIEMNDDLQSEISDPFFLRPGREDSAEKLGNISKDNDVILENKNSFFSKKCTTEKMNFFQRQENSNNQFGHRKNFQNFPNSYRRDSTKFKNERVNYKSFKQDKFAPRNYHDKFEKRSKSTFDRNNSRYQRDFNVKREIYAPKEVYGKGKQEHNSEQRNHRNGGNNFVKNKIPHKKDDASSKPLHPSWEAKRKQKELVNTSFQGKRMVFDD